MSPAVHKGLTRASILDAAFAIVEREGAEGLSMRRLAGVLGVAAMAVYNHFDNRDALLDALADRVLAIEPGAAAGGGPERDGQRGDEPAWRGELRRIVLGVAGVALRHSHAFRLATGRPSKPESAARLATAAMGALRRSGLGEGQASAAYHAFVMLLSGLPYWLDSRTRHERAGVRLPPELAGDARVAADWAAVQRGTAEEVVAGAVEWLLDAVERAAREAGPAAGGAGGKRATGGGKKGTRGDGLVSGRGRATGGRGGMKKPRR